MIKKIWFKEVYRKKFICIKESRKDKKNPKGYAYWIDENSRDLSLNVDTIYCDLENDGGETKPIEYTCGQWIKKMKAENIIPFESKYKAKEFLDRVCPVDGERKHLVNYHESTPGTESKEKRLMACPHCGGIEFIEVSKRVVEYRATGFNNMYEENRELSYEFCSPQCNKCKKVMSDLDLVILGIDKAIGKDKTAIHTGGHQPDGHTKPDINNPPQGGSGVSK